MDERPVRAGSRGWWKIPVIAASVVGVIVGVSGLVDGVTRSTAWDECERSDLDLVRAAGAGDVDMVRTELDDGHDPDQRDENGNTALGCAIPHRRGEVVPVLLERGADANQPSGSGSYEDLPTELAYELRDVATLGELLSHGADPDRITEAESPLLVRAIAAKDDPTVGLLLAHGADPSHQGTVVPLGLAAVDGTDASVQALLDHGAAPNGDPGERPIVAAARGGRIGTVEALLAAGADLSLPATELDATPASAAALAEAAGTGSLPVVDRLLALGADPNAAASNGALLRAATFGHVEVVEHLLAAGADPNSGGTNRFSLAFTLDTVNPALVEQLDTSGWMAVPVTQPTGAATPTTVRDWSTDPAFVTIEVPPIAGAIASGRADVIGLLLDHGADPNRLADGRFSPLYLVSVTCDVAAVELLLGAGADPAAAPPDLLPAAVACPEVRPLLGV